MSCRRLSQWVRRPTSPVSHNQRAWRSICKLYRGPNCGRYYVSCVELIGADDIQTRETLSYMHPIVALTIVFMHMPCSAGSTGLVSMDGCPCPGKRFVLTRLLIMKYKNIWGNVAVAADRCYIPTPAADADVSFYSSVLFSLDIGVVLTLVCR
jgi:hypothetical protein